MEASGFGDDYSDDDSDYDYSDYFTFFSVWPNPTVTKDCAASSAPSRPHVHVRFSHRTADNFDDDVGYGEESQTICLSDDLLAEGSNRLLDDCRDFIFCEGLSDWPIDFGTVIDIADDVIEKARQFKCNLQVDMWSVQIRGSDDIQETYEDDRDFGAAAEGVNGTAAASDGGFEVRSLKRKRIECGGNRCVICLEELTEGTDAAVMPCSHNSFHDDCLSSWVEISPSCPLCRRKMSAPAAAPADSRP
ncbi:PREDICTED: E3 ubiquitin ligase BIG BROTHER-related-like [Ipomoea nil]|uniref:E3 ubiquitin ligase BIG BROTHER-related-like n=1 Tax=Ipomoea nil TaxID=35883 RepID=UPI000901F5F7|nr:PREDICTED: E3 ubiquitin ligase BIG BROTHER-related-like [Ipomoea nil]